MALNRLDGITKYGVGNTNFGMSVNPIGPPLVPLLNRDFIRELGARRDTTSNCFKGGDLEDRVNAIPTIV